MKDKDKTKEQLISELAELHKRLAQLKTSETERKQMENEIVNTNELLRTVFNSTENAICVINTHDFTVTKANDVFLRQCGAQEEQEVIGKTCYEITHHRSQPCEAPDDICPLRDTVLNKIHSVAEHRHSTKENDKQIIVEVVTFPLLDESGKVTQVVHSSQDITERKQTEETLRKSKEKYEALINNIPEAIYSCLPDKNATVLYISDRFGDWTGYYPDDFYRDAETWPNCIHPEDRDRAVAGFTEAFSNSKELDIEYRVVHKDTAQVRYVRDHATPVFDGDVSVHHYDGILSDVTERKQTEEKLRESEEQYRSIVNLSGEVGEAVIMLQDTEQGEGIQAFVSDAWPRITGYSREELVGMSFFSLVHPKDREASQERYRSKMKGKVIPGLFDMTIIRKDGTEVPVELTSTYTKYKGERAHVAYIRDITERKKAEEKIKASLAEKEMLLKEVHHRVKNNMQVISSLLKLQSGFVNDKEVAAVFKDSQDRIKSMALVYNKLYQAEDLAHVDFREYVGELARNLVQSYKTVSGKVTASVEGDDVFLGVDQAIPCGLVVNELLTNSLKYAFPNGRDGEIRFSLAENEGEVELTVSDNGVGIPPSLDLASSPTLGLHLVGNLVEQLGGKIELDRTAGARFRITFRKKQE